jgi:oligopeptidase B
VIARRPLAVAAVLSAAFAAAAPAQAPKPPVARVVPKADSLHGDVRIDNYAWLRNKQDSAVINYLESENIYTAAMLKPTQALQDQLYREMVARTKETDETVPMRDNGYYYYSRTLQGKQYPILCRRKGSLAAPEEIMLDENALAVGTRYFAVGSWTVSPDNRLLAFLLDTTGAERFTLVVKDLVTGAQLPDRVSGMNYNLEWAADNKTLFYGMSDSADRPFRILRHTLGAPLASDALVAEEPDVLFELGVSRTKDRRFLLIESGSFDDTEIRYIPADHPTAAAKMIKARGGSVLYSVDHRNDQFVILTNDHAMNFRVMTAPDSAPGVAHWKPLIAERDSVLISGMDVFKDYLVLYERGGALQRVRVVHFADMAAHEIAFDEPVYGATGGDNPDFATNTLRFVYSSMITPRSVYDYDMATRKRTLLKRTEVPNYDPSLYRTERVYATSPDGVRVPLSVLYRAPLVRDGKRPAFLTAYGSYGSSSDPTFNPTVFSLVDRGYVYVIAHIRGGSENGRRWYEDGRLMHKKNTFIDFVSSASWLETEHYTSPDRLAIRGGSAGGLLIGASINMRPELFKAVIADVPFVDVINTMLDPTIPLTAPEWLQWGDPHQRDAYYYMKSYAPYENVERKAYPAMLVTAGLNDPRVGYFEPAKWVAKLRAMKTDTNTLILRTNMGAGHFGASGRYDRLKETALRYAFVVSTIGVTTFTPPPTPVIP